GVDAHLVALAGEGRGQRAHMHVLTTGVDPAERGEGAGVLGNHGDLHGAVPFLLLAGLSAPGKPPWCPTRRVPGISTGNPGRASVSGPRRRVCDTLMRGKRFRGRTVIMADAAAPENAANRLAVGPVHPRLPDVHRIAVLRG